MGKFSININMRSHRLQLMVCLFLILASLAVYWQVQDHDFVNYDDDNYVTENPHVQAGLTREGIIWAFTTFHACNWHPITWLSHMLDCQIYGLNPGGHHVTGLLFHIANTLLLFVVLKRMTGALWQSALVAALFALHPLHVESVAWVAERKDVLSVFFMMITMWAYVCYVECPTRSRYLLALFAFALGLMSKPMLVTLPFVLLLLDYWPLGRLQLNSLSTLWEGNAGVRGVLWEKAPFFALAAVSSIVTLVAQQAGMAVKPLDMFPFQIRLANALVAYVSYIGKMIWPNALAVFYPHPGMRHIWQVAACLVLLTGISVLVIRERHRRPYLAVGWLWYLGTLMPVAGLVQAGEQSMADRYTYLPLIGLFIIIAWGVADITQKLRHQRLVLAASTGVLLSAFMISAYSQAGHWRNSITLYKHTLSVTDDNWLAHNNLGVALAEHGSFDEAISHYSRAVRIKLDYASAHNNLGLALAMQERFKEAIGHFSRAVQIKPGDAEAHNNLGVALVRVGRLREAIGHFSRALQINPNDAVARRNLHFFSRAVGKYPEASNHVERP